MSLEKLIRLSGQERPAASPGEGLRELAHVVRLALTEATTAEDPAHAIEMVYAALSAAEGLDDLLYGEGMSDWVEATAAAPDDMLGLSGNKPYGDVQYADPGYQADGKKRYPVDTEEHVRAANSYINMAKNAGKYTAQQLAKIKSAIKSAMAKHGIGANVVAASALGSLHGQLVELAAGQPGYGSVPMHHGPMKGRHGHAHTVVMVHDHEHDHLGDSSHGMSPECRNQSAGKAWPNPHHMGSEAY